MTTQHFEYDNSQLTNADFAPPIGAGKPVETDAKGRPVVQGMTDRELAEETVVVLRATQDLIEGFMADFSKNPMMGTMLKMFGGGR